MRISDWSSDVCSSDCCARRRCFAVMVRQTRAALGSRGLLACIIGAFATFLLAAPGAAGTSDKSVTAFIHVNVVPMDSERVLRNQSVVVREDIGRVSWRERWFQYS